MKALRDVICIAGLSFGLLACTQTTETTDGGESVLEDRDTAGTTGAAANREGTLDVADLMAKPDEYFGRTVTVVADVEEVFGPMAFALDEDAPLRGGIDRDILVLAKNAGNLADIDDQWLNNKVRVTGTVGRVSVVEVEREIGWDLDPQIETELERAGAILIASSVERVQQP
jgi:hypothetical protein